VSILKPNSTFDQNLHCFWYHFISFIFNF